MSIVWSLKRLFEPDGGKVEELEHKALREEAKLDGDPDLSAPKLAGLPPPPQERYRCVSCGREDTRRDYCPACLADTMKPV